MSFNGLAESLVTVDSSNPEILRVKVSPVRTSTIGLLEVIDAKTGDCLKTLHAGTFSPRQIFSIKRDAKLSPGKYRIRFREGISLAFDGSLVPSGNRKWTNPTDLVVTDKSMYVLDSGKAPPEGPPPEKTPVGLEGRPYLYKFHRDKTPDVSFGDQGRVGPLLGPSWDKLAAWCYNRIRSIAVDSDERVYLSSIYHEVLIYDAKGQKLKQVIGGWDNNPFGTQCTTWVNSIAMGPQNRIYLPSSYKVLRVYDRTKEAFKGVMYSTTMPNPIGFERVIASDMAGTLYIICETGRLQKFVDTGSSVTAGYLSDSDVSLVNATGPSASGDLIWVAAHGGAPLWDYDAGEVAMFWDTGEEIHLVDRYGSPGTAVDKLQFMNPSSVVQSPDHLELWVVEDGMINEEGPPGNARIRKFKITSAHSEEVAVEIH